MSRLFLIVYSILATIAIVLIYRKYKELKSCTGDIGSSSSLSSSMITDIMHRIEGLEGAIVKEPIMTTIKTTERKVEKRDIATDPVQDKINSAIEVLKNFKRNPSGSVSEAARFLEESGFKVSTYFDMFGIERYKVSGNNSIM